MGSLSTIGKHSTGVQVVCILSLCLEQPLEVLLSSAVVMSETTL